MFISISLTIEHVGAIPRALWGACLELAAFLARFVIAAGIYTLPP
jgi:hypothetical protein